MTIDMTQFLQTFYEESFEGLDIMESELLNLDVGAADVETINTIFRAAHSIKGGSGTFGLSAVAEYTHVMETLLDEMRDGRRQVTQEAVDVLLKSVDVLRAMLTALRDEEELDHQGIGESQKQLDALLVSASEDAVISTETETQTVEAVSKITGWAINFRPHTDMLKTGNDTFRMLRELTELGTAEVQVDLEGLPAFSALDPEESYLSWSIDLTGDIAKEQITEIFEWVDDECDLDIQPVSGSVLNAEQDSNSELNIELLETSFTAIAPQGEQLVKRFYQELFSRHPEVESLFKNTTAEKQQTKLLAALKLVVENLRNPEVLKNALIEMGARHQGYGAKPEHYAVVRDTLLEVMAEIAGSAWTDDIRGAWTDALNVIAGIMMDAYKSDGPSKPGAVDTQDRRSTPDRRTGDRRKASTESASIRVSIDKVDELINTVGELVITQSMLGQFGEAEEMTPEHIEKLRDGLGQLERYTRELQESVMRIRMLPISFVFQRFPRLVHDLSGKLNKKIDLQMSGEGTELDKTVMEKIGDPLVHLVRNSIDHGIEMPDVRAANGKDETGVVHLNAYHQGGNIVIEITDDGAGLNREKILNKAIKNGLVSENDQLTNEQIDDLVFSPGLSTADEVSDISGRGVGMDVVRKNIRSLGGTVEVKSSPGSGSTFSIRLPLTLAILDGQLVTVGEETYIVPLVSIVESIQVKQEKVNLVSGRGEVYKLRDEYIPVVRLYHLFDIAPRSKQLQDGLLVVVEAEGQKIALYVDDLQGQQQVVIKSLETNYKKVEGLSGATILGDGTVALILDISGLVSLTKLAGVPDLSVIDGDIEAA
ncbi:MAG: chemotaxis protein CheW [Thioalkalispiraceae bacterium]|jgi:two-component system chemotaxis sensor kinase CheA